jgi:hypothetical protein
MTLHPAGLFIAGFILLASLPDSRVKPLFNGKDLKGWETYIGPHYDTVMNKFTGAAAGLNVDPWKVFSVVSVDGRGAMRISGEHFGGISTLRSFRNYHLRLEFKWGKRQWHPKRSSARDSGLLYHAVGPHGADGNFWMRSQEFQVQEGDCGDYWGVAGAMADIPAKREGQNYVYDPSAPMVKFSEKSEAGRHCVKYPDAEKPSGQWNTLELYCLGDTSVHVVNGVVTMIIYNLRQESDGNEIPLKEGKIQIQSEGAEVFYRDISVRSIRSIPSAILKQEN